jgi:hypothetical protein
LALKIVVGVREQGTGNREQGTGNRKRVLSDFTFPHIPLNFLFIYLNYYLNLKMPNYQFSVTMRSKSKS